MSRPVSQRIPRLLLAVFLLLVVGGILYATVMGDFPVYPMVRLARALPPPTPPTSAPQVLFVGDSLTAGFAASTEAQTYAAQVTAALGGTRLGAGRFGYSAAATAQLIASGNPLPAADDVVIELGTNDSEDAATFQAAYQQIVNALHPANPSTRLRLICLSPWQDPTSGLQPAYWSAIQRVCGAAGGAAVSIYALYLTGTNHGPAGAQTFLTGTPGYPTSTDWFHPNDAGHAAIAQAILNVWQTHPV